MSDLVPDPESYFRELTPLRSDLLQELEAEARREDIPIIGPVVGELLYVLARASGARRILELGTATGYSAIYLADACRHTKGLVVTVENNPAMAERAVANIQKAGLEKHVEIVVGDALEEMEVLDGPFDLAFMDIDKSGYDHALASCTRLLRKGGLLVVDNVAFQNAEAFNRSVVSRPEWRPVHLFSLLPGHAPERDGLCLALRV
jgi:predicted O-methyltransferase YrrM